MKTYLRLFSVLLTLLLPLTLIGCQSEHTDTQTDRQPQIPIGVWEMSEPLTLPGESAVMSDRGFARDADGKTDREALSALLSFCRDYKTSDTLFVDDRKAMQIDGTILTNLNTHMQSAYRHLDLRYEIGGGEPPVYVGFPSAGGSGSAVSMREGFAITTEAAGHELASRGAWAFVRYVIETRTYDTQGSSISYFGAAKASLDRMFDSAENVYCLHYDPNRADLAYYGKPHQHSEQDSAPIVVSFDEDDRAAVRDLISGITTRADAYPTVYAIVYEEASAYFAGAKTLEQTVDVVASRTELYFNERK